MRTSAPFPIAIAACVIQFAGCAGPRHDVDGDALGATRDIEAVVDAQRDAWNRGDLGAFMALGYRRSPDLTFYSGGQVATGYDEMLAHYRASYEAPGKELGKLAFTNVGVNVLSEDAAVATGRWDLDYDEKKDVGGLFTLVFRRLDEGWRIVHDHTSVDG